MGLGLHRLILFFCLLKRFAGVYILHHLCLNGLGGPFMNDATQFFGFLFEELLIHLEMKRLISQRKVECMRGMVVSISEPAGSVN